MARPSREPAILAAALAVFAENGYDATRVRDIARRAGMSNAALYTHYVSKEAVALALFHTHVRRYAAALEEVASAPGATVEERIRGIADRSIQTYIDEPHAFTFVMANQPRFIASLPADFPYPIRIVERLIREGQDNGSVKNGPVRLLAALVFGCIAQPIRTVLEAPTGTISVRTPAARALIASAAWAAVRDEYGV